MVNKLSTLGLTLDRPWQAFMLAVPLGDYIDKTDQVIKSQ